MISFETSISLTITLLVGFITIAVTNYGKNAQEKGSNKPKHKKIFLFVTIAFLICLVAVWSLYFIIDSSTVVHFLRFCTNVISEITPVNRKLFQSKDFVSIYLTGYAILALPVLFLVMRDFFLVKRSALPQKFLVYLLDHFV